MNAKLQGYLIGTAALSVLLLIALAITVARPRVSASDSARRRLTLLVVVTVAAQAVHFTEELMTRFYERFPVLLGLQPWSFNFFVIFNLTWLAIWLLALPALRAGIVAALVPFWFLALACLANLVAHPLLALGSSGYFPGLFTAPVVGVAGLVLFRELLDFTRPTATDKDIKDISDLNDPKDING